MSLNFISFHPLSFGIYLIIPSRPSPVKKKIATPEKDWDPLQGLISHGLPSGFGSYRTRQKAAGGRNDSPHLTQEKRIFMEALKGFQKKYLRGLAHALRPVVIVGRQGVTGSLLKSVDQALNDHELIKIKFNEFKEKAKKAEILAKIEAATGCQVAGMIGHTAICFRSHPDPEKRVISLPTRSS
jgi:RNA-binding protein